MKILEILRPLSYLLEKEKEWGGYVNLLTGKIDGPWEGERHSLVGLTPEEERAKRDQGWVAFHCHPTDGSVPEPSGQDFLAASLRGAPEYVITARGIWEVKPVKVLSIQEVRRLDEKAWAEAQDLELQHGGEAYWFWNGAIQQALPVKVRLLES